jgi:hypothetical protein
MRAHAVHRHLGAPFFILEENHMAGTDTEVAPIRDLPPIKNKEKYEALPPELKQYYLERDPGSNIWYYVGV